MSKSWYANTEDKGQVLVGGTEGLNNSGLSTIFREMALMADNGYDIVANRYNVTDIETRVIIESNPLTKHGEKIILFEKAVLRTGDLVNYTSKKYLISSRPNEDISMNDSAPMHLCNTDITYEIETKTATGQFDELSRPTYTTAIVEHTIPAVFDTERFYSDNNQVVNLEKDIVECWVQYNPALLNGLGIIVSAFEKGYSIEGISRDLLFIDGSDYYGVLRLRLRFKE